MLTKAQITEKLNANHNKLVEMVSSLSEADFLAAPSGKWTAGQQLEHIYKSVKPLTMAIGLPKIALRVLIGKANRPSRDYDAVVAKYHEALAKGGKAPYSFIPAVVSYKDKDKLAAKVKRNVSKLISGLDRYSEQDLDKYLLPHPLLGGLTVREMLYFTIYHSEHHYKSIQQNFGK
jgi:DinB superfamily